MNATFMKKLVMNDNEETMLEYKGSDIAIGLYSYHTMPGFVTVNKTLDGEDYKVIIHHMYTQETFNVYCVTIGRVSAGIELTTSNTEMPLEQIFAYTVGALAISDSLLDFMKNFEEFTGNKFVKF